MLTMFGLPKPFRGHIGVIQRNAITSWSLLRPKPEIILFGDEEGTGEIAQELGLRHVPPVRRNQHGTPFLNDMFDTAQTLAAHPTLAYVNPDILLFDDFMEAVQRVKSWRERFLIVGQRTNLDVSQLLHFESPEWYERLRDIARHTGVVASPSYIDYFVFARGLYSPMPAFVIGRTAYDNWMLWKARSLRVPVVNTSAVVLAIHQNHDYYHLHPQGRAGLWQGEEALANQKLAGGRRAYGLDHATHSLTAKGIRRNFGHLVGDAKVRFEQYFLVPVLALTAPIRHPLGLRRRSIAGLMARIGLTKGRSL